MEIWRRAPRGRCPTTPCRTNVSVGGLRRLQAVTAMLVLLTAVCPAVPVADIKAVITGKDCPHMKEKGALKQNKVRLHAWM